MNQWWQWQGEAPSSREGFAVIGVGRFGSAVCMELLRFGVEVLAIDASQRAVDELRQRAPAVEARVVDCTDEEALRAAGVLDVATVVVAISDPIEASITATLIVKDGKGSRVRQVIARATSDLHVKMLKRVGADKVVFPSQMQGTRLGMELVRPNLLERLRLDDRNSIEEIKVPQAFVGRSLRDLNLRKNFNVSVLAAGPNNRLVVNPPASQILQAEELLVVMGTSEALEALPSQ
ncbi:MAG: TrkA family potassium uptake protein [Cyanobacteria bacterium M_surface_7_m2_040]|nr:TrkA family potassium uptake protein [Cyanobacteria bacterium K_Offshore_0m_m2_072]MBM5808308.1 TrkA family potassium uptake protein [Cyanobacteria bacterium M_surface_9_m1_291]MBM5827736.1 TrkA family potassium uptake protein [Cyanobacteria bacterium M_surface_7_m2_040]